MAGSTQWTDLDSVLSDKDGRACLYGYLRAMDVDDPPPRCLYKHIELLDAIALLRQQEADQAPEADVQERAQQIVETYVTSNRVPGGRYESAPSLEELKRDARDELRPLVLHFRKDMDRGGKTKREKMKKMKLGYRDFTKKLNGGKK